MTVVDDDDDDDVSGSLSSGCFFFRGLTTNINVYDSNINRIFISISLITNFNLNQKSGFSLDSFTCSLLVDAHFSQGGSVEE